MSDATSELAHLATTTTPARNRPALAEMIEAALAGGDAWLRIHFAALPRRIGKALFSNPEPIRTIEDHTVDLGSYRACDLAATVILRAQRAALNAGLADDLYANGDAEERRMILKALPFFAERDLARRLLAEAHRSNDESLFAAGLLDSDFPARVLDDHDYANAVLKAAFLDCAVERLIGAPSRTTPALSAMLCDFMAERQAAGRSVWPGTLELAAWAPCPGVTSRICGEIWHGDDRRRLAAARAAAVLPAADVLEAARQRLDVEPLESIRRVLSEAIAQDTRG